jgi:hypothetical protein
LALRRAASGLTQLAQFGGGFHDFAQAAASQVK